MLQLISVLVVLAVLGGSIMLIKNMILNDADSIVAALAGKHKTLVEPVVPSGKVIRLTVKPRTYQHPWRAAA